MNHSDQPCLVQSHETITLHREETLLSFADYFSGDRQAPACTRKFAIVLSIFLSSSCFFFMLSNVYHRIPCCIRTTITDWFVLPDVLYDIMQP